MNPEDYLDVDALEMHGPSAVQPQVNTQQQQDPNSLEGIQAALFSAEQRGDTVAVSRLSMQLDDLVEASMLPKHPSAPEAAPTDRSGALEEYARQYQQTGEFSDEAKAYIFSQDPEAAITQFLASPEGQGYTREGIEASIAQEMERLSNGGNEADTLTAQSELDNAYNSGEVKAQLETRYGADIVNEVHEWANENMSEESISQYVDLLQSDDEEAVFAFDAFREFMTDEQLQPETEEYAPLNEGLQSELVSKYGDHGRQMIQLNQAYISGQITEAQMHKYVLTNPDLMRSVFDARKNNLISY